MGAQERRAASPAALEKAFGEGGNHPTVCSMSGTRSEKGTASERGEGQRLKVRSEFGKVTRANVGGPISQPKEEGLRMASGSRGRIFSRDIVAF